MVRQWLGELGVKTLFIEPGSPWENGYNESFNGTLRNELLRREIFYSLQEAKVLIEQWRREYNTHRPHKLSGLSTPGLRSDPARPKAAQPTSASWTTPQPKGGACTNTLGGTAFGGSSIQDQTNANIQSGLRPLMEIGRGSGMVTLSDQVTIPTAGVTTITVPQRHILSRHRLASAADELASGNLRCVLTEGNRPGLSSSCSR